MNHDTRRARAIRFRELHRGPRILVLPNAWDAASARIFEEAGVQAIGTTSAGIAASYGYADGEGISRAEMLDVVRRIAAAVKLPVTADMVAGFGDVQETVNAVIAAGAIGMNVEDATATGVLVDLDAQTEKIGTIRRASEAAGISLVINARTDVYLLQIGDAAGRFDHAVRRANAYRQAGADCLFVPGVRDAETISRLVTAIEGPINILAVPGAPPIHELEKLGVRRVSVGSGPMRATLALTARIARELRNAGTYSAFADALPYADMNRLFEERK
jgi:2-methylisocitrate lyase-like PEP mutase family enzyme